MKQISGLLFAVCLATHAFAAPKAVDRSPFEIEIHNQCNKAVKLQLGQWEGEVQSGENTAFFSIPTSSDDWTYSLLSGSADLALLSFQPSGRYSLTLDHCTDTSADVYTVDKAEKPAKLNDGKSPEVRFRSRQVGQYLEYQAGKNGRFMPLSIAMTRFKEVPAGEFEFTIRVRSAQNGPILKTIKKTLQFTAGHRYLIEAHWAQSDLFFKAEDEGWIK